MKTLMMAYSFVLCFNGTHFSRSTATARKIHHDGAMTVVLVTAAPCKTNRRMLSKSKPQLELLPRRKCSVEGLDLLRVLQLVLHGTALTARAWISPTHLQGGGKSIIWGLDLLRVLQLVLQCCHHLGANGRQAPAPHEAWI